jgi:hypothetical protein
MIKITSEFNFISIFKHKYNYLFKYVSMKYAFKQINMSLDFQNARLKPKK